MGVLVGQPTRVHVVYMSARGEIVTASTEIGITRSLVAIRMVVTMMPDPVVRSSGVATTRLTRITGLMDVPFQERFVSVVSEVALVLRVLNHPPDERRPPRHERDLPRSQGIVSVAHARRSVRG